MKTTIYGLITAFSMYSAIPMPKVSWDKNSMKFALVFFPLVGFVISCLHFFLYKYAVNFNVSSGLFASLAIAVSIAITGGLHLDGYIDTCDALNSRKDMAKKYEILKDPHVGAFGVIMMGLLLVVQFGAWTQIYESGTFTLKLLSGFVMSRVCASYFLATEKISTHSGIALAFSKNADKKFIKVAMYIYTAFLLCILYYSEASEAYSMVASVVIAYLLFTSFVSKEFDGISGDLLGFFIILFETVILILSAIKV